MSSDLGAVGPPRAPGPPWSDRVIEELRAIAAVIFRAERPGHTLQPTAIVHEAWLRMARSGTVSLDDRDAFLAFAATTIRHILVDHARRHLAQKRGGGRRVGGEAIEAAAAAGDLAAWAEESLALDGELELLAKLHPRSAQVCEMRYFGGLTDGEIAARLGVTDRTVRQDWATARAWLLMRLSHGRR